MIEKGNTVKWAPPTGEGFRVVEENEVFEITSILTGYFVIQDHKGDEYQAMTSELTLVSRLNPVADKALLDIFAVYLIDRERDIEEGATGFTSESIAGDLTRMYYLISHGCPE